MIPPELPAPIQIGVLFLLIAIALAVFIAETLSIELTALSVIAVLVLFFHFFPIIVPHGQNSLGPRVLLSRLPPTADRKHDAVGKSLALSANTVVSILNK